MTPKTSTLLAFLFAFFLLPSIGAPAHAQGPTTGRIAGTIKDQNGAVIVGAEVTVVCKATGDVRRIRTDAEGNYTVSLLPPGADLLRVNANGFATIVYDPVLVVITEPTRIDSNLTPAGPDTVSVRIDPILQRDGPQLGRVVESRAVAELPLATRNFTQILGLSPGTAVDLPDNTALGRNAQNISVNGARTTQNSYQINGVDANNIRNNNFQRISVPAPETIQEFKVQTSLYDATFGRSGGNIQAITRSGGNEFHGAGYGYFRTAALNANNPFLK